MNFVENTNRMVGAQKLSGIPLYYSCYSDFSELRFRKSLMTNNIYPKQDKTELEHLKLLETNISDDISWDMYVPQITSIHPSIKCASNWAVAVTSLMYMQYKEKDPLWNVFSFSYLVTR